MCRDNPISRPLPSRRRSSTAPAGFWQNVPRYPMVLLIALLPSAMLAAPAAVSGSALATVSQLHDTLDQLYLDGSVADQAAYFAEHLVRLDPNRQPTYGRQAWIDDANAQVLAGCTVQEASTTVLDAWQVGDRIYEYGLSQLLIQGPGTTGEDDPTKYFAVWDVTSDPLLELIIWNTSQPVEQTQSLAAIGARLARFPNAKLQGIGQTNTALATARQLHQQLDALQASGSLADQAAYFTNYIVRLEPNRAVSQGNASWESSQQAMSNAGVEVQSQATTVLDAWQAGTQLFEYGTADLVLGTAEGSQDDPTKYFAVWNLTGSQPQIELLIWNSSTPVPELELLCPAGP